jgi:plastocyanin
MQTTARRWLPLTALVAAFLLVSGLAAGIGSRSVSAHGDEESHPAHIHSGSCATLGDVVYPLNNVGGEMMDAMGTPMASETMGATDSIPVDVSITTVNTTLADLTSEPYAINVHESAENIGNYIACGDIGGMMMGSYLAIGLGELNESGYSGIATLQDNGDGTTTVTVFLTEEYGEDHGGEEEATPMSGGEAPAATEVAVSISGFAFNPDPITITAGTTVTWTNEDSAAHTATQDGGGFQSGTLNQGDSFSQVFDTPGTYEYHCEFHANMHGTIIVQ